MVFNWVALSGIKIGMAPAAISCSIIFRFSEVRRLKSAWATLAALKKFKLPLVLIAGGDTKGIEANTLWDFVQKNKIEIVFMDSPLSKEAENKFKELLGKIFFGKILQTAIVDQRTMADDDNAVAQLGDIIHIMTGEDDGGVINFIVFF